MVQDWINVDLTEFPYKTSLSEETLYQNVFSEKKLHEITDRTTYHEIAGLSIKELVMAVETLKDSSVTYKLSPRYNQIYLWKEIYYTKAGELDKSQDYLEASKLTKTKVRIILYNTLLYNLTNGDVENFLGETPENFYGKDFDYLKHILGFREVKAYNLFLMLYHMSKLEDLLDLWDTEDNSISVPIKLRKRIIQGNWQKLFRCLKMLNISPLLVERQLFLLEDVYTTYMLDKRCMGAHAQITKQIVMFHNQMKSKFNRFLVTYCCFHFRGLVQNMKQNDVYRHYGKVNFDCKIFPQIFYTSSYYKEFVALPAIAYLQDLEKKRQEYNLKKKEKKKIKKKRKEEN